ncbi:MAG: NAD(P)-binding domain-containing protein [Anaerolineae bacterium]|nr:NAD(P)-binding domain-containing protein [Anaerolineae bacterium]
MIVIVGAGPAGLTTAYYAQQRGLPYQVLEKHTIGYAWRNHYDNLHLNSLKELSGLPGFPMPDAYPAFPSASQFVDYLKQYAQHFNLNIKTGVTVRNATYTNQHWELDTSKGIVQSDILVVAAGIWSTPNIPTFGGEEEFGGKILHSRDYRNAVPFLGHRVLVVGIGNSGSDIAADLGKHGVKVAVSIRNGAYFVEKAGSFEETLAWVERMRALPRAEAEVEMYKSVLTFEHLGIPKPEVSPLDCNAVVGLMLPNAIEAGLVTVYPCIERLVKGGVRFIDGREEPFDTIILATGFRPTVHFVHDAVTFDSRGQLCLSDNCRSTNNPHLYCVGFNYPVTENFLHAVQRESLKAVEAIALDCNRLQES